MRKSLLELIEKTILYKYDLPYSSIEKTIISTTNDKCYSVLDNINFTEIIYNSIIDYSFNEFDIENKDFQNLHTIALRNKLKYNPNADDTVKLKYGFFGEVILYCILVSMYKAKPLIARGYFYNPLENAETKGYDSYHLIDNKGITELWFGEVKFHISHTSAIDSVMKNINKALSDWYLETNVFAIHNHKNDLNITGTAIESILNEWEKKPEINILDEIKKHKIKLIYPVLLLYEEDASGYDNNVKKVPEYIKEAYSKATFPISIDYSIFFMIVPIKEVKNIKQEVIKWIEAKRPPMS